MPEKPAEKPEKPVKPEKPDKERKPESGDKCHEGWGGGEAPNETKRGQPPPPPLRARPEGEKELQAPDFSRCACFL